MIPLDICDQDPYITIKDKHGTDHHLQASDWDVAVEVLRRLHLQHTDSGLDPGYKHPILSLLGEAECKVSAAQRMSEGINRNPTYSGICGQCGEVTTVARGQDMPRCKDCLFGGG